jgi:hypothetical protein
MLVAEKSPGGDVTNKKIHFSEGMLKETAL